VVKLFDKVKLKSGNFAHIVDILEPRAAYIAEVILPNGDYETEEIRHGDIAALIVEVEQPLTA
jgi:hypothetical protein